MAISANSDQRSVGRRSFLKNGMMAGGAALGVGMLSGGTKGLSEENYGASGLTKGDIAILRFVADSMREELRRYPDTPPHYDTYETVLGVQPVI